MKLDKLSPITASRGKAIILSETTPASLDITGADVDGLADDYVLAQGSVIITPGARYKAFSDGLFTEVETGGGGGGGGNVSTLRVKAEMNETTSALTLDKTWNEIKTAVTAGAGAYIFVDLSSDGKTSFEVLIITTIFGEDVYGITAMGQGQMAFITDDPDGYPVAAGEPGPGPDPGPIS